MTNQKQDYNSAKPNTTNNKVQQEVGRNEGQVLGQMNGGQTYFVSGDLYQNGKVSYPNISSAEVPLPKKTVSIPPLLPYLANRSDQEYQLNQKIKKYLQQRSNNPLICIFHGDEYQCHEKFFERLQKKYLPRMLNLDENQSVIRNYDLPYPSGVTKSEEFSERLCFKLAEEVEKDTSASTAEINQTFSQYPCPIIIKTDLLTKEWEDKRAKPLDNLLNFWDNWPQLALNQQLIVCISVKYEFKEDRNNKFSWWSKILDWWSKILEFWKTQDINKLLKCYQYSKLNETIGEQLVKVNFSQFENLDGVVLSELSGISKKDVQDWAKARDTKEYIGEERLQQLINHSRDLFDNRDTISMEDLANELRNILEKLTSISEYSI